MGFSVQHIPDVNRWRDTDSVWWGWGVPEGQFFRKFEFEFLHLNLWALYKSTCIKVRVAQCWKGQHTAGSPWGCITSEFSLDFLELDFFLLFLFWGFLCHFWSPCLLVLWTIPSWTLLSFFLWGTALLLTLLTIPLFPCIILPVFQCVNPSVP